MTTLQITPNWKNKTARFRGTIAAGEHVAVRITNDDGAGDEYIQDMTNLRLRVVNPANGKTLAQFPMPQPETEVLPIAALEDEEEEIEATAATEGTGETWGGPTPLTCTLNLNTDKMLMAVPPGANVPLLFVLDAYREDDKATPEYEGEFTLYFKDMCEVTHWPRRTGEEEPVSLDDYKDIIADFREDIYGEGGFKDRVENSEQAALAAAESARLAAERAGNSESGAEAAMSAAQTAAANAANAKAGAETAAENSAQAASDAQTAQRDAEAAQSAAEAAAARAEAALPLDTTLSLVGKAADAKAVGDKLEEKYTKPSGGIPASDLAAAVRTSLGKADTALQQHQSLDAYVNAASYDSTAKKILLKHGTTTVAEVDATAFIKDGMVSSVAITGGKLIITFNTDAGLEPIEIPLTDIFDPNNYYTKAETNAALAGKASTADATLTPIYSDAPTFSEWSFDGNVSPGVVYTVVEQSDGPIWAYTLYADGVEIDGIGDFDEQMLTVKFGNFDTGITATRTRTDIIGYTLGSQSDKPLQPKGDYAPATNITKSALAQNVQASLAKADTALQTAPVTSVNGQTGAVVIPPETELEYALADEYFPITYTDVLTGSPRAYTINSNAEIRFQTSTNVIILHNIAAEAAGGYAFGFSSFDPVTLKWDSKDASIDDLMYNNVAPTYGVSPVLRKAVFVRDVEVAPLASPAFTGTPTAPTPASGDNSTNIATTAFVQDAARYTCGTLIAIDSSSVQTDTTDPNNPITYVGVVLTNRTSTIVQINVAIDELRVEFPAATEGKVRDFGLAIGVGYETAALAAPALVVFGAGTENITLANSDGAMPELADGTATMPGYTLLYFSEIAPGEFLVKGEQMQPITQ